MKLLKKLLPHVVALVVFAAVSALFFAPQYQGKALRQGDMVRASGMGQDIKEHVEEYGEHPQWAGNMFSGMPAYLIDMNYEGRYVKNVGDMFYFMGQPAAFLFIAMASFYLMLMLFGVNPWIGIIGGLAYGLSTYFPIIIEAGHITKMMALAWIPGLIGAIYYAYRRNYWMGGALAGLFAAMEISTSHPQIYYYFLFVILALVVNEFVRAYKGGALKRFFAASGVLAVAAVLAIGANLVQLYYVAQHTPETTRGRSELVSNNPEEKVSSGLDIDYATEWSYGKGETFNLFIPNLMGGASHGGFAKDGEVAQELKRAGVEQVDVAQYLPSYWGDQMFTEGPVYIGALVIFLAIFGIFALRGREKWWLVGVTALALLLSWGHNLMWFTELFFNYFPMYNKFRVPSMILVVVEFTLPLLGVLALSRALAGEIDKERVLKSLKWSAIICGGFAIFAALILPSVLEFAAANDAGTISGMFGIGADAPTQYKQIVTNIVMAMENERASMLRMDALRSLLFVTLGAGVIYGWTKGWLKNGYAIALLAVFVTTDLYSVDRRYVKTEDFTTKQKAVEVTPSNADLEIMQDTTNYRVVNFTTNPFTDATTSYFHRAIGGYHAAKLQRYQDLIDRHLSKNNMEAYNMLNTKYFITAQGVMQNPDAAGNAWFVDSVAYVKNANEEIDALGAQWFEAQKVAVVDERFKSMVEKIDLKADSTAKIELLNYKVNHLTYKSSAPAEGLAIFSEIYYNKGWRAYIDGKETEYLRADYILRALTVPAGEHTIEWKFEAPNFALISTLTRISSLILLLGALAMIAQMVIKAKNKNEN